ncbi:hypothetical protein QJS66_03320 [Kocuria rhizophila]|nr:hypothetical protein QJS66_03320 [Kocuria rhizophila]
MTSRRRSKLTENSFRTLNTAFANELPDRGQVRGSTCGSSSSWRNHHPRVKILQPGPGVDTASPWTGRSWPRIAQNSNLIRTARRGRRRQAQVGHPQG